MGHTPSCPSPPQIAGLLDLYGATGDYRHLEWAFQLQGKLDLLFWDEVGGGYFQVAAGDSAISLRMKEVSSGWQGQL